MGQLRSGDDVILTALEKDASFCKAIPGQSPFERTPYSGAKAFVETQ